MLRSAIQQIQLSNSERKFNINFTIFFLVLPSALRLGPPGKIFNFIKSIPPIKGHQTQKCVMERLFKLTFGHGWKGRNFSVKMKRKDVYTIFIIIAFTFTFVDHY